ncbi:MAG: pyridoxamine 5'-phosphate oxidase family protein [Nocardioides sp.]|nr:pyridoxamine 5'-phosphate oxidase family protein [Nocardioides sp.]
MPSTRGRPSTTRPDSFDVLTPERCLGLLAVTTVGRVAFVGAHGLEVLPVNYRVVGGLVMVRTSARGTLSELASYAGEVVFESDYHSSVTREGWSVVVRATSSAVSDPAVLEGPDLARLVPWAMGVHDLLLALRPHQVTGRRISWLDADDVVIPD